jgi:putative ABC transport system permease protein
VGVVKDFHFNSLHQEVTPAMLILRRFGANYDALLARLRPGDVSGTVSLLRSTWQEVAPDVPFQYSFLDDDLDKLYHADERWSRIVAYAASFAIVLACLGLFGLAALSVAGRTKEIGIRKVLGASVPRLARLLSRQFALLVGLAVLVALPAAYVAMSRWLEGFAYRVEIRWWVFVLAGVGALVLALVAVGYQTVRAALSDPVKALRYE